VLLRCINIGLLLLSVNCFAGSDVKVGQATLPAIDSTANRFTQVSFGGAMSGTPLVFTMTELTSNAEPAASIRIHNVTASGFDIVQVEPELGGDGHMAMTIDYIAIVPGTYTLEDGNVLEAGSFNTKRFVGSNISRGSESYQSFSFTNTFNTPAMVVDVQSMNTTDSNTFIPFNPIQPWLETAVRNFTGSGAQFALDRSKTSDSIRLVNEDIGYLVAESGLDTKLTDTSGNYVRIQTITTTNTGIRGIDDNDGCYEYNFASNFDNVPVVVANKVTRNGGHGGWLRRCSLTASQVGVTIDEDSYDNSRNHGRGENASFFAFSGVFEWATSELDMATSIAVERDSINDYVNPKAIPGAWVRYTLDFSNEGALAPDSNSLVISQTVPDNTELYVGNLMDVGELSDSGTDSGNGAIQFFDTLNSGLSLDADDISFTISGARYLYSDLTIPADGFDGSIDSFTIQPTGQFTDNDDTGNTQNGVPSFQLQFRIRLK